MGAEGYPADWIEATQAYLAAGFDRLLDRSSTLCQPDPTPAQSGVLQYFPSICSADGVGFYRGCHDRGV